MVSFFDTQRLAIGTLAMTLVTQVSALNGRFAGINYSPIISQYDVPQPDGTYIPTFKCKSEETIRSDLEKVASIAEAVKLYDCQQCNMCEIIADVPKELDIKKILYAAYLPANGTLSDGAVNAVVDVAKKHKLSCRKNKLK